MLSTIFLMRFALITWPAILVVLSAALMALFPGQAWWLLPFAGLCLASVLIGIHDLRQTRHAVLRNYPVAAHLRFLLESIRPEMRQYFFEGDKDGAPFPRDKRAIVYQRAKRDLDKRPFGTMYDVYEEQYEWLHHSIAPRPALDNSAMRTLVGATCPQPYSASLLNISAMSYGSLSANAIRSLNKGAKAGGFFHDTGEGGVSPYHRENGGDLVWEIGSGYFGARAADGSFDAARFQDAAADPQIKMVELKLSQGAKPGLGGVLPAAKVTEEISRIRG
nr:glutamate synthase-related protein [Tabrizicola sp.]